ncbi:MAG: L-threonylcarbamoyladenylate synthase [Bacillota bacterium]
MRTRYFKVDPLRPEEGPIAVAAGILRQGGLVAFPTETVYGLGANAMDSAAVARIYQAKGRPSDNPLIVHVAEEDQIKSLVNNFPERALSLMTKFWPGPLTLVLERSLLVPDIVTAGLDTVAIRMPAHPVALALIKASQVPVAAPSANFSGRPSPTSAQHVLLDLEGRIEAVVDGGAARVGIESTVLDLTSVIPAILRPGGVTREQLEEVLGEVQEAYPVYPVFGGQVPQGAVPRAPGMKYAHYAPRGDLYLVRGSLEKMAQTITCLMNNWRDQGKRIGVLASDETLEGYALLPVQPDLLLSLGSRQDLADIASKLFGALRECDRAEIDVILAETYPHTGMGAAVMNRLIKAAAGKEVGN